MADVAIFLHSGHDAIPATGKGVLIFCLLIQIFHQKYGFSIQLSNLGKLSGYQTAVV
jgi:hypothetical protein